MANDNETKPLENNQANENEGKGDNVRASWNVSLDQLQANIDNSSPEAQELMAWCFLWCINAAHPMRLEEFALQVGSDKTTIRRIIQGTYKHPETGGRMQIGEKLVKAMKAFRELETERAKSQRTGFVLTPTAQRIFTACDLARESRSPVFLIGPSHVGKTWALVEYKERNNHGHTIYVRLQAASGLMGMVKAIGEALGLSEKTSTILLTARIKRTLKKRPNLLIILDEVHQLIYTYRKESFFSCLEVLREIYDETGVGMVICGTEILTNRIRNNRSDLEQLLRRGVHKVSLPDQPTPGDIAAICGALGLEFPKKGDIVTVNVGGREFHEKPWEVLRQVSKEEGLKAITERLRYGTKFASKEKAKLTWEHVVRAHFTIMQNTITDDGWGN